jgi:predicted membrane-bound spermidine synthase
MVAGVVGVVYAVCSCWHFRSVLGSHDSVLLLLLLVLFLMKHPADQIEEEWLQRASEAKTELEG